MRMRKSFVPLAVVALLLSAVAITGGAGVASAGASAPSQGVTATTIRVGIPYVDLAAVRQFGITLDQGSFPDAYNALIANLNTGTYLGSVSVSASPATKAIPAVSPSCPERGR